jgi:hypothetical protein
MTFFHCCLFAVVVPVILADALVTLFTGVDVTTLPLPCFILALSEGTSVVLATFRVTTLDTTFPIMKQK